MATKKVVKKEPAVPDKTPGLVVTKFGTFQIGIAGVITQIGFPQDVAKHTGIMNASEVESNIRGLA